MPLDARKELYDDWDALTFGYILGKKEGDIPPEAHAEFARLTGKYLNPAEYGKCTVTELRLLLTAGQYLAMDRQEWSRARELNDQLRGDERWNTWDAVDQVETLRLLAHIEFRDQHPELATGIVQRLYAMGGRLGNVHTRNLIWSFAELSPPLEPSDQRWIAMTGEILKGLDGYSELEPGVTTNGQLVSVFESTYNSFIEASPHMRP